MTEIRNALTTNTANLFAVAFRADFLGGGEATAKAGFAANDIYDWTPARPTRLFHGADDTIVPYSNSTTAFSVMNTANVTLVGCNLPDGFREHEACVPDFLGQMFNWFDTLVSDL